MMATVRCLLALCVFGLLFGSQVGAMRASQEGPRSLGQVQQTAGVASQGKHSFGITGAIQGLYPGARVPLQVEVKNPYARPLDVRSIKVQVENSNVEGCGREWVRPGHNVEISTLVPPKSTSFVSYPVWMLEASPAVCQGATWRLTFHGTGAVSPSEPGPSDDGLPGNDSAAPTNVNGSVLPFTGFSLMMIVGIALASVLIGVMLVALRRSGDEA